MSLLTVQAHYDGVQVQLDEKIDLQPNTRLLVTVLEYSDSDRDGFLKLSSLTLAQAYSEDEIEYTEADLTR